MFGAFWGGGEGFFALFSWVLCVDCFGCVLLVVPFPMPPAEISSVF